MQSRRRRTASQPPRDGGRARRRAAGAGATGDTDDETPGSTNRHALRGPGGKLCRKDGAAAKKLVPLHTSPEATPPVGPAPLPAQEGGCALAPTHGPLAAVPPPQGRRVGAATAGRPRPHEDGYNFVVFLYKYSKRPIDLPSWLDEDRPGLPVKQCAHHFALQLSRARAFHSGLMSTWNATIPFVRSTGEQLRERNIYLSWISVHRTEPP